MKNKIILLVWACFVFLSCPVWGREVIESFDSVVEVQIDGSLIVTETITVHHEGMNIKRGIYRDLSAKRGEQYELISVKRNGVDEPSFVKKSPKSYRINTGDDSFLNYPATSVFEIKYKVWNALKKFDKYDELYWNVTGGNWSFLIEKVSARVELPEGVDIIRQASYIGATGSQKSAPFEENGKFGGENLGFGKELTIAVGFTPNIVLITKHYSTEDMVVCILSWAAYIFYLGFLIFAWNKKGRDPSKRAIMPQYEPPCDISAAKANLLYNKIYQDYKNVFIISLIQMVTNGFLELKTINDNNYVLTKTGKEPSNCEEKCFNENKVVLNGKRNDFIIQFSHNVMDALSVDMNKYYKSNSNLVILPSFVVFIFLLFIWRVFFGKIFFFILYMGFMIIFCSQMFICKKISTQFICATIGSALLFCFANLEGNLFFYQAVLIAVIFFTGMIFAYLLYQPTILGSRVIEHLEGLELFLKTVQTPIKFEKEIDKKCAEKLFPYAVALGLEKEWKNKFGNLFNFEDKALFNISLSDFFSNAHNCIPNSNNNSGSSGFGHAGGGFGGGGGGGR